MRTQNQYASDSMRLPRFTYGNSYVQQNNANCTKSLQLQNQFYSAAPNRLSPASTSLSTHPPTPAPGNVAPAPMTNSSHYQNDIPHQRMHHVGSAIQPASKPANSRSAATGQQAMPRNNAGTDHPQQQAVDVDGFFSLSELELDDVLASLANSTTTGQQKVPTTNSPRVTSNLPTTGGQAIHVSVPVGAEVLEVREASMYPGAYDIVTTAGTFTAYGQTPAVDKQPQQ